MQQNNEKLINWLFETKAFRVCQDNKPFWYTSGSIGPYFINTHFLYGNEQKANNLLELIDEAKKDLLTCPEKVLEAVLKNYETDTIFKGLIDMMVEFIISKLPVEEIDAISGGERRDWFFSLMIARLLKKPHITLYKDLEAVITKDGQTKLCESLSGMKILHVADLITEASSYERAWIPAIKSRNGNMQWSMVVVDRKQGGAELLGKSGVTSLSMIDIDHELFDRALEMGLINKIQHAMLLDYYKNPKEAMKVFLKEHPEFMEASLKADEKTQQRALLCIEKGIYN